VPIKALIVELGLLRKECYGASVAGIVGIADPTQRWKNPRYF